MTEKEREKYFNKVLIYLYQNQPSKFSYVTLVAQLEIPKEYKDPVWRKLWHSNPQLIGAIPGLQDADIWINEYGIEYVDELENSYFEETGLPLFATFADMSIQETCEAIFQKHKESKGYSIEWAKGIFKPTSPANLPEAKEIMLSNGVLFRASSNPKKTILDESVHTAISYKEALKIIEEKNKQIASITTNTTHGKNSPIAGKDVTQKFNRNIDKKNFLEKIWDDIRNATVSHCVVATITLVSGLLIGKSCNQSPNQAASQSLPQNNNDSVSQNKSTIKPIDTSKKDR